MTSNLVDNQSPNIHRDVLNSKGTKSVHKHMAFASGYVYLSGLRELRPILQRVADARQKGMNDSLRILMGRSVDHETHAWVAQNKAERRNAADEEAKKLAEELGDSKAFKPETEEVETLQFLDLLKELMTPGANGFVGLEFRIIPDAVLHAKAYLFTDEKPVEGQGLSDAYDGSGYALAGSANLTSQGLTRNLELGLGSSNTPELKAMAAWFEKLWVEAVAVNEALLEEARQHWPVEQPSLEDLFLRMQYLLVEQELDTPMEERQADEPQLADFQLESISEARWRLEQRGGVMLAHVVGLGKTFMGAKLLKTLARRHGLRQILVFCPKAVRTDWIAALQAFKVFKDPGAVGRRVISIDMLGQHATPEEIEQGEEDTLFEDREGNHTIKWEGSLLGSAELILVDESHRLRNPGGKNYKNLKRAIEEMQSRIKRLSPESPAGGGVIFCTATPIAKEAPDVFRQLELFWKEKWIPGSEVGWDEALKIVEAGSDPQPKDPVHPQSGIQPRLFGVTGGRQPRLQEEPEDQEDARVLEAIRNAFIVRRTRGNVAMKDEGTGRSFVSLGQDHRLYFPQRQLKTLRVGFFSEDHSLYDQLIADLGQKGADAQPGTVLTYAAYDLLQCLHRLPDGTLDLARLASLGASEEDLKWYRERNLGQRLRGAMRTLLFKRLDSSPYAFLETLQRMQKRIEFMFEAADGDELPLPSAKELKEFFESGEEKDLDEVFARHRPASHFDIEKLKAHLQADRDLVSRMASKIENFHPNDPKVGVEWDPKARALLSILNGEDNGGTGVFLDELRAKLGGARLEDAKVLIFTQYADTVTYLKSLLTYGLRPARKAAFFALNDADLERVKGRFSPSTMPRKWSDAEVNEAGGRIDILLATDKLSEGCNLQEAQVVINYDLPWAPHTLIQRVGRVDRLKSENQQVLQINFLVDEHIQQQLSLQELIQRRMQQIHQHIGEDNKVVTEEETLNDLALKRILLENPDALDAGDPDDQEFSRPNMIRRLRKLREQDPERFKRIVSMRMNQRAAWGANQPSAISGAVMVHPKKSHPPRLQLASEHHQALLESEALLQVKPEEGAARLRWDASHWKDLASQLTATALPRPQAREAAPDLFTRWQNLIRRGADTGGVSGVFEDLLRERLNRWIELRQDERERYRLPAVAAKTFAVGSPEAWHQAWDAWLERFELIGSGASSPLDPNAAPQSEDLRLGVALVPVMQG